MPHTESDQPMVSIVVPAYNEAGRITESIRKIRDFIGRTPLSTEVIIVDDGSSDQTAEIASRDASGAFRVVRNGANHGKGYSVRQGFMHAHGRYVLFTDADLSAPIEELNTLFETAVRERADIVIGSRAIDRRYIEKHQARFREIGGMVFNAMVRVLLGLRLNDTQCGFKLFQRERCAPVFRKQVIRGFGFDPEILFIASRRGLRIREVPVRWSHAEGSKVRFLRDGVGMFFDLVKIRWNYISGKYR